MALTRDQIEELRLEMKRPDHRSMAEVAKDLGTTNGVIAGAFSRAGKITRLPPGHAIGAKTFFKQEY